MSLSPLNLDRLNKENRQTFWKIKHTINPQTGGTRRRSPQQTPRLTRSRSHRSPVSNNRTIQYVLLEKINEHSSNYNCIKKSDTDDIYKLSDCLSAYIHVNMPNVCHLSMFFFNPLCGVSYTDKTNKHNLKYGDGRYMLKMFISFIRKRAPKVEYFILEDMSQFSFAPIKTNDFWFTNTYSTEISLKAYFSVLYGKTYYQREYGAYLYDGFSPSKDLTDEYEMKLQETLDSKPKINNFFDNFDSYYKDNYSKPIVKELKQIYNESENIGEFFNKLRDITQDDFMYYFVPFSLKMDKLIFSNEDEGYEETELVVATYAIRADNAMNHLKISINKEKPDKYKHKFVNSYDSI